MYVFFLFLLLYFVTTSLIWRYYLSQSEAAFFSPSNLTILIFIGILKIMILLLNGR